MDQFENLRKQQDDIVGCNASHEGARFDGLELAELVLADLDSRLADGFEGRLPSNLRAR